MNATATRGYPIGALFVLVTAAATLIAGLAPVLRTLGPEGPHVNSIINAMVLCIVPLSLLGGIIGLFQYRWFLGGVVGIIAGAVVGVSAGLLSLAPSNLLPGIAIAFVVGSGLMIGIALVMRQGRA
jgi:hypothetical protein